MGSIKLDSERTLQGVAELAFFDVRKMFRDDGAILLPSEMDAHTAAAIAGIEVTELFQGSGEDRRQIGVVKKIRLADRGAALDKLMRYHALYKDKLEHSGEIRITSIMVPDRIATEPSKRNLKPEFEIS